MRIRTYSRHVTLSYLLGLSSSSQQPGSASIRVSGSGTAKKEDLVALRHHLALLWRSATPSSQPATASLPRFIGPCCGAPTRCTALTHPLSRWLQRASRPPDVDQHRVLPPLAPRRENTSGARAASPPTSSPPTPPYHSGVTLPESRAHIPTRNTRSTCSLGTPRFFKYTKPPSPERLVHLPGDLDPGLVRVLITGVGAEVDHGGGWGGRHDGVRLQMYEA
ncbi:hypothetical protein B5807_08616 [Epicoccum nigrum]|uniref:Uncharacterized protein n=1 Tax=Epicoccum nigrum TaxID=105696 RepID=A0A1Y2LSW7_EPING|nr:hypothetical protein B5807_08616 [Epicoccum nigrum]